MSEAWEFYKNMNQFFADTKEGGLFFAITGKHFLEWLKESLITLAEWIYNVSDLAILIITIFTMFAMAGSRRVMKYIYWTSIGYLSIKAIGSALL